MSTAFITPLLEGTLTTIQIAFCAILLSILCAFIAGALQLSKYLTLRLFAKVYIEIFRGTSALVQLFWVFFVFPFFGIHLPAFTVAVLVLGLNIGAYGAEVVRGAISSIDKTQYDAARALNLSQSHTFFRIILPQAIPIMLPSFGNLFIELIKNTALVSLITLNDLTFAGMTIRADTMKTTEIFLLLLLIYFMLANIVSFSMTYLSKRYGN